MATVAVAFARTMDGPSPVIACIPNAVQSITSGASSTASTITAGNDVQCQITVTGGNVWVKFGAAPTAAAGSDYLILDGQTREFGMIAPGHKVAVIDA